MIQFILSCLLLLSILLWWAEAQYSFIYRVIMCLKRLCGWIKKQTKLKIDICKWFLPCLLIVGAVYTLYYPYYKQTLEFKEGNFVIKEYPQTNENRKLSQEKAPKEVENEKEDNPIGDWGTFGDFVGGTLNPIIGFISILLLFATWKLTTKTLNFTKEELKNSNELLNLQQFDTIFWGLLENLKKIEDRLYLKENSDNFLLDRIYHQVFLYTLDESLSKKRQKILDNAELSQYFIVLYQIFKNIDEKIDTKNFKLKKSYSNILRSNISTKILQLLAINCYEDFPEYKKYLEKFGFLEHMPFYFIMDQRLVNLKLLECIAVYDTKVFDRSIYFEEYLNDYALKLFFEGKPKSIDNYLECLLSGLEGKKEINLTVNLGHDQKRDFELVIEVTKDKIVTVYPKTKTNIYGVSMEDLILRGDPQYVNVDITKRGLELKIYNLWIVINSLKSIPFTIEKNPS